MGDPKSGGGQPGLRKTLTWQISAGHYSIGPGRVHVDIDCVTADMPPLKFGMDLDWPEGAEGEDIIRGAVADLAVRIKTLAGVLEQSIGSIKSVNTRH